MAAQCTRTAQPRVPGASWVQGPIPEAGDPAVNKTNIPVFVELAFQGERQTTSEKEYMLTEHLQYMRSAEHHKENYNDH